ncbi:hypothetical protein K438DRAFT_1936871 [Mycena galopus ATCC 62051]|nr:hypothetical protein K438DRAFT_1936871 [Mycena galopus ATCC 62051]
MKRPASAETRETRTVSRGKRAIASTKKMIGSRTISATGAMRINAEDDVDPGAVGGPPHRDGTRRQHMGAEHWEKRKAAGAGNMAKGAGDMAAGAGNRTAGVGNETAGIGNRATSIGNGWHVLLKLRAARGVPGQERGMARPSLIGAAQRGYLVPDFPTMRLLSSRIFENTSPLAD